MTRMADIYPIKRNMSDWVKTLWCIFIASLAFGYMGYNRAVWEDSRDSR